MGPEGSRAGFKAVTIHQTSWTGLVPSPPRRRSSSVRAAGTSMPSPRWCARTIRRCASFWAPTCVTTAPWMTSYRTCSCGPSTGSGPCAMGPPSGRGCWASRATARSSMFASGCARGCPPPTRSRRCSTDRSGLPRERRRGGAARARARGPAPVYPPPAARRRAPHPRALLQGPAHHGAGRRGAEERGRAAHDPLAPARGPARMCPAAGGDPERVMSDETNQSDARAVEELWTRFVAREPLGAEERASSRRRSSATRSSGGGCCTISSSTGPCARPPRSSVVKRGSSPR